MFTLPRAGRSPRGCAGEPARRGLKPGISACSWLLGVAAIALTATGCAQELPGTVPPADQLHYPLGLKLATVTHPTGSGERTFLVVGSSNFDQRFNAGRLFAMDPEVLAELARAGIEQEAVAYREDIGAAITGTVRVDSLSGVLDQIELEAPLDGRRVLQTHILSPSRLRSELTVVRLGFDGTLSCTTTGPLGAERQVGFDCTDSHRINLVTRDAFEVAVTRAGTSSVVAVGSVGADSPDGFQFASPVSFLTTDYLQRRVDGTIATFEAIDDCYVRNDPIPGLRGTAGFVPLPTDSSTVAAVLGLSLQVAPALALYRADMALTSVNATCDPNQTVSIVDNSVSYRDQVRFDSVLAAIEARGIVTSRDGRKAYSTVRFLDIVDTSNSGVVVLDIVDETASILYATEIGEELGRPNLDERPDGSRLLYIGDSRFDFIYVVDVTNDVPQVVARIESRGVRQFDGDGVLVNLLDSPTMIVFYETEALFDVPGQPPQQPRRLAFVSNFLNSTLAVMDVTDPDPRRHRVVARLGRDLDPQGESEEP